MGSVLYHLYIYLAPRCLIFVPASANSDRKTVTVIDDMTLTKLVKCQRGTLTNTTTLASTLTYNPDLEGRPDPHQ